MNLYKTSTWLHLIAITLLVILYTGYQFNIYDQEDHLPQVYKLLSPELYANDFFVNEYFKTFNVRFYYVSIVLLISKAIGVYGAVTILHFISILFTVYFTYKLAKSMGADYLAALAASLFLPTIFNTFNLGLSNFTHSSFIAGNIALPLCLYSFSCFFNSKYITAGVAAGIACLFQALMGLHVFILMGIASLFNIREVGLKNILLYSAAFIVCSAPMLFPVFSQQFFTEKMHDPNLVTTILTYIRNPHHYVPSFFPLVNYLKFGSIIVLGIVSAKYLKKEAAQSYYVMLVVSVLGMLVYYIGFEKLSINFIAATQWFKISVWVCLFGVIALCSAVSSLSQNLNWVDWFNKFGRYFSLVIVLLGTYVLINSASIPVKQLQGRYHIGNYQKSDLTLMHEWINKNTEINATFIIPPNDESFLCEAQRSALVSYKPMIHQENYQVKWLEKMEVIFGVSRGNLKDGNAKNTLFVSYYDNFSNLFSHHADYIIAEKTHLSSKDLQYISPVFESGTWVLLKN